MKKVYFVLSRKAGGGKQGVEGRCLTDWSRRILKNKKAETPRGKASDIKAYQLGALGDK